MASTAAPIPPILTELENNRQPPFITAKNPLEHLLPGYKVASTSQGEPKYAVYGKEIIKSPNDDRSYRMIILENGMEALLISDPTTDKAAAAMDVKVGHLNDPEDLQGLAHFCEHLMFMGTEKYPKENEYTEFLTQNSGFSNAFTGMDQTNYYFDIHPTALYPALDRFAQFFISPIFDPSCTEREANAVHSENSKNLQSDMWRFFQLDKSTSSRAHSFWRFGTGNKETLWDEPGKRGEDVRGRLIEWQEKYYSANLMKLVVLGKDDLETMTKEVVEKFSPAPNRHLSPPYFQGSPLGPDELQKQLLVKAVKDQRLLELSFPFPDEDPMYAAKAGGFLSHLLGHEGPGSVLSYLKKKGWANGMSAGAGHGAAGFEFLKMHIDLTQDGIAHREDVVAAVFKYIDLIKASEPQQWAFDEVNRLSAIAFQFKEKAPPSSTVMTYSIQMSKPYPRSEIMSAPYLSQEWQPEILKAVTEILLPQTCRLMVATQQPLEGYNYDQKEQWYGTEYTIVPMPESILKLGESKADFSELALPKPNEFLPTNLEVLDKKVVDKPAERPLNLKNAPTSRLWYKKDDRWWVPRVSSFFLMRSPLVDNSAFHQIQGRFFTELVKDSLVEYAYDADLAGLSYTLDCQGDGIVLSLEGYNDKLPVLAKVIFERIANFTIDPKRFDIVKDQLQRAYVNFRLEQPHQHAGGSVLFLTHETSYSHEAKLAEIANVTVENLTEYIKELLSRMHIESLVHGNILKEDAIKLGQLGESIIKPSPLTAEELRSHRALIIPEGKFLQRKMVGNVDNANSAVEQFTYVGDVMNDDVSTKLRLLVAMVSDPLFDKLRGQEQLGYIVQSGLHKSIGFTGMRIIVQSEKDAAYVESRIDNFWNDFLEILEKMDDAEFERHRTTVINKKLEDHKNMWQESSHLWIHIHAGYLDFNQKHRHVEHLKTITKEDMITFFKQHFLDTAEHRVRRLTAHIRSHRLQPESLLALKAPLEAIGVPVDEAILTQFASQQPTLEVVKQFTGGFLKQFGKSEKEVEEWLKTVDEVLGGEPPVPEGVTLITDPEAYRAAAERGPYAYPATEYVDLFPAKL